MSALLWNPDHPWFTTQHGDRLGAHLTREDPPRIEIGLTPNHDGIPGYGYLTATEARTMAGRLLTLAARLDGEDSIVDNATPHYLVVRTNDVIRLGIYPSTGYFHWLRLLRATVELVYPEHTVLCGPLTGLDQSRVTYSVPILFYCPADGTNPELVLDRCSTTLPGYNRDTVRHGKIPPGGD